MQTATNPQTGEKIMWNGSAWVPAGSGTAPAPQLPRVLEGPPKEASPQTPEQRANTQTNVAQGQQSLQLTPPKAAADFIKDFTADPAVKAYRESLPVIIAATQAGRNGAGDLSVVYGWAKTMDPSGSVREGDTELAQSAAGPSQRAQFLVSQYHLQQGGTLPPEVRHGLIEEMRNKGRQLDLQYSQKYQQTQQLLKQAGIDPTILGPHEGDKYRAAEEGYVRSVNGPNQGPTDPSFVALNGGFTKQMQLPGEVEFGVHNPGGYLPPGAEKFPGELTQALKSGEIPPDPYAIMGWAQQHGGYTIPLEDAKAAAAAMKKGILPAVADVTPWKPDISDVRGGQNTDTQDAYNAGVRGLVDTPSMGLLDKGVALGDTIFKGGTFDQNLARQYAISDFDSQNHPIARAVGQVAGGFAIPMGEIRTVPQLIAKSAGLGAAYSAGSSRSLSEVPVNALMGAATGAATGAIIGGGGKAVSALRGGEKEVPPLVDDATGELNQPMDAMSPTQRSQEMQHFGIETQTPGMVGGRTSRVLEQGFNNLPGSAGHMEDVNSAVSGEVRRAMQGVAEKFGSSKTLNEGGAEVQRGAQDRIARGPGVISKAYSAIPIPDTAPASKTSTVATLQSLTGRFQSNPDLAASLKDPKLAGYLDALQKGDISWKDLKDFRSIIGEKIGEMRFGESSSTSDLRALYAGLSEDMRNTAAAHGPKAVRAFERANTLNRQNEEVIQGALTRILGKDGNMTPEKAAAAIQAMTLGGKSTGDLKRLAQIRAATIKSGAWDEIASTLIHLGGQPANSTGRAFQPDTFVRWYADMAEPARAMLFKPELRKELERFVAVNQQLSRLKGLNNTSQTAPVMFGGSALLTAASATMNPMLGAKMAGVLGANFAMGKLWTTPAFVRLATGYTRALASGNENAVKSQVGRLQKLAVTNPELRGGIEHLLRSIANDNVAPSAVAGSASDDQQQRQQN